MKSLSRKGTRASSPHAMVALLARRQSYLDIRVTHRHPSHTHSLSLALSLSRALSLALSQPPRHGRLVGPQAVTHNAHTAGSRTCRGYPSNTHAASESHTHTAGSRTCTGRLVYGPRPSHTHTAGSRTHTHARAHTHAYSYTHTHTHTHTQRARATRRPPRRPSPSPRRRLLGRRRGYAATVNVRTQEATEVLAVRLAFSFALIWFPAQAANAALADAAVTPR